MPAFAAGRHRMSADPRRLELDHRDEAIAVIAVPALGPGLLLGTERGERAIAALRERHGQARGTVAVRWADGVRDTLDSVDLAPRHIPAAEIPGQANDCRRQCAELLLGRGVPREAHHYLIAGLGLGGVKLFLQFRAPDHSQRLSD